MWITATYPDMSAGPLVVVLCGVVAIVPVVLYPFTYTLWFAVEMLMDPPSRPRRWRPPNVAERRCRPPMRRERSSQNLIR